jgi:hypothetical protein
MPNFTARISDGTVATAWQDPRTNPLPGHPPRYHKAEMGTEVVIKATVGGVEGPADGALGGDLFETDFVEYPTSSSPVMTPDATHTSIQRYTPTTLGHYFVLLRRLNGGAIGFHFDVEVP